MSRCHEVYDIHIDQQITQSLISNILEDIKSIVEPKSQTDPSFKSTRLYTRITSEEVRRQLIVQSGYQEEELPSSETIRRKLVIVQGDSAFAKMIKTFV